MISIINSYFSQYFQGTHSDRLMANNTNTQSSPIQNTGIQSVIEENQRRATNFAYGLGVGLDDLLVYEITKKMKKMFLR